MRRRRSRRAVDDGLYQRTSRCTGDVLPTWWMRYHHHGALVRESTGTTDRDEAVKIRRRRLVELDDGTYQPDRERLTIADILDAVVHHYTANDRGSTRTTRGHVETWKQALGATTRARDVTTGMLLGIVATWQAAVTAATCNRRLGILRRAYRLAKFRLDPAVLDFGDVFLVEKSPRGRYITPSDVVALLATLPAPLRPFVEFAYLTGVRKQQLARTTWAHVNRDDWILTWQPDEVKAKHPHILPLDGRALEIVQALDAERRHRGLHCPYVFHGVRCAPVRLKPLSATYACVGDFKKAWATASKKAGFPVGRKAGGYTFHNTRHTAVTNLVNSGTPKHEAMNVSGHRTGSVFDRYSIQVLEQTRAALRRTSTLTTTHERKIVALPDRRGT